MKSLNKSGWFFESERHALARRGIKTAAHKQKSAIAGAGKGMFYPKQNQSVYRFGDTIMTHLVHTTSTKHVPSILKRGFKLREYDGLRGIYTFHSKASYVGREGKSQLKLTIHPNATIFWTDTTYPSDVLNGHGSKDYARIWARLVAKVNPKYFPLIEEADALPSEKGFSQVHPASKLWDEASVDIFDNPEIRSKFMKGYNKYLDKNGIDIVQQGGEYVILDPSVIKNIEIIA